MATKKDLIEAQTFSRRRLLTAFTSGAPGGKELEPAKPLRAVIASITLAVMVVLVGLFYGYFNQGLPDDWESNRLVVLEDTGSRFVSMDATLYPALNTTSARLLIPADEFTVVATDSGTVADIPVGPAVGIVGAPDDVPAAQNLVPTGWSACVADGETAVAVPGASGLDRPTGAALVTVDGVPWVVADQVRYAVDPQGPDAVLRAVGLEEAVAVPVESRWLNLFAEGAPLAPLVIDGAGQAVDGTSLVVGSVLTPEGSDSLFLVTTNGELRPLSSVEFQLYQLGTGASLGGAREVAPADIANLPTAPVDSSGQAWPDEAFTPIDPTATPCASLTHTESFAPVTTLATTASAPSEAGVSVAVRGGALARVVGAGDQAASTVALIDQTGTAFPIPGSDDEILARLGYTGDDETRVPSAWSQFFPAGPDLTVEAAGRSPESAMTVDAALRASVGSSGRCEPGTIEYSPETPEALSVLQADAAGEVATGAGVTIAVVDSGIDAGNAHLASAVVGGVNLAGDDEADGYVDFEGHGTAVAGAMAARAVEGSGVVGVAPDADLLAVRVYRGTDEQSIEAGHGPTATKVAAGIEWAVDNGADIINVSLSDESDHPAVRAAVQRATQAGILVVASAGNATTADAPTDTARFPAAYDEVLGVAAATTAGVVTDASIHGEHVDLAAPGQNVLTSATGAGDCLFATEQPQTSFATAYAAGAAALVREEYPDDTIAQTTYRLTASAARANPDHWDEAAGWGIVQPYDALALVPGSSQRGPDNPFTQTAAQPVAPGTVALESRHVQSPLADTRALMVVVAVVGATALASMGTVLVMRRRRDTAVESAPSRPGLLDSRRRDATKVVEPPPEGPSGAEPGSR
ncbi:type VII secretion protein EccB [Demequina globuliformis]|uniref:type VII secretion protein EccB n=1 Tax=Demequina globuliformis TaxID=676202 RepID=UPI0007843962|nr:type VII secretion protein EccB [Demequina globuliformis]